MERITATKARQKFFDIMKGATEKHKIYRVNHRKGSVVILSEEEFDNLTETLELLSIPGFPESIKRSLKQMNKGETASFEEAFGKE